MELFDKSFRKTIADQLNDMPCFPAIEEETTMKVTVTTTPTPEDCILWTMDDVHYVMPTPRVKHGILQICFFVQKNSK